MMRSCTVLLARVCETEKCAQGSLVPGVAWSWFGSQNPLLIFVVFWLGDCRARFHECFDHATNRSKTPRTWGFRVEKSVKEVPCQALLYFAAFLLPMLCCNARSSSHDIPQSSFFPVLCSKMFASASAFGRPITLSGRIRSPIIILRTRGLTVPARPGSSSHLHTPSKLLTRVEFFGAGQGLIQRGFHNVRCDAAQRDIGQLTGADDNDESTPYTGTSTASVSSIEEDEPVAHNREAVAANHKAAAFQMDNSKRPSRLMPDSGKVPAQEGKADGAANGAGVESVAANDATYSVSPAFFAFLHQQLLSLSSRLK